MRQAAATQRLPERARASGMARSFGWRDEVANATPHRRRCGSDKDGTHARPPSRRPRVAAGLLPKPLPPTRWWVAYRRASWLSGNNNTHATAAELFYPKPAQPRPRWA